MRLRWIALFCLWACAPSVFAQKQVPLRQYLNIRSAAAPTIAPDGKSLAYMTNVTGSPQLWTIDAKGGWPHQITFFSSGISSAHWSPKGDSILVVADTDGDEQFQLYLVKPDGTDMTPLDNNPKVRHDFGNWSDDGKYLCYTSNARNPRFFDCYVMDIETRSARLVFQKDAILGALGLSPDNKTLLANQATSNVNEDLYLVEVEMGKARHLTPHQGDVLFNPIGFAPDAKSLLIATNLDRDFLNLAKMELESGKITFLKTENYDILGGTLTDDKKTLALTTNREGYGELSLWDAKTLRPKKLPALPRGNISIGGFSADGKMLALSVNTPTRNTDVWTLDVAKGSLRQVTFSSLAGIDAKTFTEPSLIKVKSFDGVEIPAFLFLPPNAPQDHSVPVIVSVHGGPEAQERPLFSSLYQYFVSRGYAVLAPNIRGSSGYGKKYLAMDNTSKRFDALKDLAAIADWVGTHPALNPKRTAIFGGSYGGFAVLAMLVHYPDKFAAGVDMFGIADFKSFLANTAPFRRPLRAVEYGDPEKDSEFLDAISPARHVERIQSPLLVIQGANDPRVPESESALIVKRVKEKGGVVEYLLFPDEGHGFGKLPNRITAFERVVAFLNKYMP